MGDVWSSLMMDNGNVKVEGSRTEEKKRIEAKVEHKVMRVYPER